MHTAFLVHLIILHLITIIVFGEAYKLWSSLLCNLLFSSVTFPLGPNILLNTMFSNTISMCYFLGWETKFHTRTKTGKSTVRGLLR
jgi:hypothetical protein